MEHTTSEQRTCTRCGEAFTPTIVRELTLSTEPGSCPAGGGAGHLTIRAGSACTEQGVTEHLAAYADRCGR